MAIWDLEENSQGAKLGFIVGDIVVAIDNVRVKKLSDVRDMGEKMQMKKMCRIRFKRDGRVQHVDVYLRTRRRHFSRL